MHTIELRGKNQHKIPPYFFTDYWNRKSYSFNSFRSDSINLRSKLLQVLMTKVPVSMLYAPGFKAN